MLQKLRKKLTLLYTLITGLILTAVVIILALFFGQADRRQQEALFSNYLMAITNKLQHDSRISQSWLASMEQTNGLIIHICEKNQPLLYAGGSPGATNRSTLIERARQQALLEGIDLTFPPVSTDLTRSSLFSVAGDYGDTYQASALIVSARNSSFSLILLRDVTESSQRLFRTHLLFFLADAVGILLLALANWRLVGASLTPIRINEEKQHAFIAAASHELRSPLAVIGASADAICARSGDPVHFARNIKAECSRMSRLVQDLLLLAAAKSNAWSLTRERLDMDTLLLNLYERYEPLFVSCNLHLKLELPADSLPAVFGDGEQISHILSVFLDNGMTYAPKGTAVTLSVTRQKAALVCAVADHGPGIPEAEKERVFDTFYQTDRSRKEKQHFGLGLSVARELAQLLGGRVRLTDTPGGGCTFLLELTVE